VSSLGAGTGQYYSGDISPDGRILALGMGDGLRLWELKSGRELAFVAGDNVECVMFQPDGTGLLTCGFDGARRWPLRSESPGSSRLWLGPSQVLPTAAVPTRMSLDATGRMAAFVSESSGVGWLLDLDTQALLDPHIEHLNASFVAFSPDGRWAATSGWHSSLVRLWNAEDGTLIEEWEQADANTVFFTPDSRELVICCGDEIKFWDGDVSSRQWKRDILHFRHSRWPSATMVGSWRLKWRRAPSTSMRFVREDATRLIDRIETARRGWSSSRRNAVNNGDVHRCDPCLGSAGCPSGTAGHRAGLDWPPLPAQADRVMRSGSEPLSRSGAGARSEEKQEVTERTEEELTEA
jgi:hypothetical protein